ncbi:hypothetical protein T03_1649 [Trichinella britovi]|uniref:Uncharacterized protein n=1 Tax=Trichinella britovi TaxID=45882 RepID=A0A0V1CSM2_TRIBR|nr:hypothetical protein T03_1649 [Trichinella britovi]
MHSDGSFRHANVIAKIATNSMQIFALSQLPGYLPPANTTANMGVHNSEGISVICRQEIRITIATPIMPLDAVAVVNSHEMTSQSLVGQITAWAIGKVARTVTCSSVLWRTSRSGNFSVLSNGDTKTRCLPEPPEVDGVSGVDGILDLAPRLERHGVRGLLEGVGIFVGGDVGEAFTTRRPDLTVLGLRRDLASARSVTALPLYESAWPQVAPLGPLVTYSTSPLGALLVRRAVLPASPRRRLPYSSKPLRGEPLVLWRTSRSGNFSVLSNGDTKTRCLPEPPEVDDVSGVDGILDLAPRLERHGVRGLLEGVGFYNTPTRFNSIGTAARLGFSTVRNSVAAVRIGLATSRTAGSARNIFHITTRRSSCTTRRFTRILLRRLHHVDDYRTRRSHFVVNRFAYRRLHHLLSPTRNHPRTKVRCACTITRSTPSFLSFGLTFIRDLATATRLQGWCLSTTHARCHPAVTRSHEPLDRSQPFHFQTL